MKIKFISYIFLFILIGCNSGKKEEDTIIPSEYWGENPWPEIRKKRINKLLPNALQEAKVDCWLVLCRENNNDPLADHIGGENAGGDAVFLFYNDDGGFHSKVFSPIGESTALDELNIHDEVVGVSRGVSSINLAIDFIKNKNFETIAINSSTTNSIADGLSFTQRTQIESLLGKDSKKLISSSELVYNWLSIKLPEEVAILTKAAELTAEFQIEAYKKVIPGKSTDADIAKFLKQKMLDYGVKDGWSPDQNPNVNSGPDNDRWVSDIQRFAYVLKNDELKAPENIQFYWDSGKAGNRAALSAMKPGVRGVDVDKAQRILMKKAKSEFVMWSTGHPVGYVAHDVGPNLGGSQSTDFCF